MSTVAKLDKKTKEALFNMMPLIGKSFKFTPECFDKFPEEYRPVFTLKIPSTEDRNYYMGLESGESVIKFYSSMILSISNIYDPISETVRSVAGEECLETFRNFHVDIHAFVKNKIISSMKLCAVDYASLGD